MTLGSIVDTSVGQNTISDDVPTMSLENRLIIAAGWFSFYVFWSFLSFRYAPIPQTLAKGKWIRMPDPDYNMHYLEWVSIVHAIVCIILGTHIVINDGFYHNRKTLVFEYLMIWNSLGYFSYDTIAEWYFGTLDSGILAHHIGSLLWMIATIFETYGGSGVFTGLYFAELSGPCFIFRWAYKRQNLDKTTKYLWMVTVYSFLYVSSRGYGYTSNMFYIAGALKMPFYLKCIFIPILFISFGWMTLVWGMYWRTIPYFFKNPEEVKSKNWWKVVANFFQKWTKESPGVYITSGILAIMFWVAPIGYAFIWHYVEPAYGFAE